MPQVYLESFARPSSVHSISADPDSVLTAFVLNSMQDCRSCFAWNAYQAMVSIWRRKYLLLVQIFGKICLFQLPMEYALCSKLALMLLVLR